MLCCVMGSCYVVGVVDNFVGGGKCVGSVVEVI